MSFDPMASAVDWLDAYRASDIDGILEMYAEDAIIYCSCGGLKKITGAEALRAYWVTRLRDYPASELDNLQPSEDGPMISYVSPNGVVCAILSFDCAGRITSFTCGPSN